MRNYEDIRNHERYQLKHHTPMSLESRAAQFAPFAALTGHEEAIEETARLTDSEIVLDETAIAAINAKLYEISQRLSEKPVVSITYFCPDAYKGGGAYLTDVGFIRKIDKEEKVLFMDSGIRIPMDRIVKLYI